MHRLLRRAFAATALLSALLFAASSFGWLYGLTGVRIVSVPTGDGWKWDLASHDGRFFLAFRPVAPDYALPSNSTKAIDRRSGSNHAGSSQWRCLSCHRFG